MPHFRTLTSVHTVLPHEDPAQYHRIRAGLIESWQPAGPQELMLVDQIAQGHWRMERSRRFENAMFELQVRGLKSKHGHSSEPHRNDDQAIAVALFDSDNQQGFQMYFRYDTRAQSTHYRALDRLRQLQNDRLRRERRLPAAISSLPTVESDAPPTLAAFSSVASDVYPQSAATPRPTEAQAAGDNLTSSTGPTAPELASIGPEGSGTTGAQPVITAGTSELASIRPLAPLVDAGSALPAFLRNEPEPPAKALSYQQKPLSEPDENPGSGSRGLSDNRKRRQGRTRA